MDRHKRHRSSVEEWKQTQEQGALEEDHLYEHYTLIASSGQAPLRVDIFLSNLLPFTSRSRIKNASLTGSVLVNGKSVKASYKVRPGDQVKLMLPFPPTPELEAEEMDLDIRYEDEDLLIVHKPPGLVCHPGFANWTGTLVHGLLWHFESLPSQKGGQYPRPGLVHRIDRDTSGLLVIAKNEYAMAHLSKQFYDHTTERLYTALVWGDVKEDQGTIDSNIGRHPRNRKIFRAFPKDGEVGKTAITHYKVIERYGVATLIQCKLETGRTHQIRVHLKSIGHTLWMDKEYGGDAILVGPKVKKYQQFIRNGFELLPRQGLHAQSLNFDHPKTGERKYFEAALPADFQAIVEKLRRWASL